MPSWMACMVSLCLVLVDTSLACFGDFHWIFGGKCKDLYPVFSSLAGNACGGPKSGSPWEHVWKGIGGTLGGLSSTMMARPRVKKVLLSQAGPNFQYTEVDEASNVFEAALVTSIFWLVRPIRYLCAAGPHHLH